MGPSPRTSVLSVQLPESFHLYLESMGCQSRGAALRDFLSTHPDLPADVAAEMRRMHSRAKFLDPDRTTISMRAGNAFITAVDTWMAGMIALEKRRFERALAAVETSAGYGWKLSDILPGPKNTHQVMGYNLWHHPALMTLPRSVLYTVIAKAPWGFAASLPLPSPDDVVMPEPTWREEFVKAVKAKCEKRFYWCYQDVIERGAPGLPPPPKAKPVEPKAEPVAPVQ
jgi:hypothetical protein